MTAPLAQPVVPVAWAGSPFGAYTGDVYRDTRPAGMTVAEIVASVPGLSDRFAAHGVVCVNGEPVPRHLWGQVRPRVAGPLPVAVTLHLPAGFGGGGGGGGSSGAAGRKNPLAVIASIALIATTAAISGGLLGPGGLALLGPSFGAGQFGATALAAGVGIVGSLAVAALTPPPARPSADRRDAAADDPGGSASASGNVLAPGQPLPRVVGTYRAFPPFACHPLVEVIGDDEVVECVFALAGPHKLEDIRVGTAPVADSEDIEVETREGWPGDTALASVTRQSFTTAPNLQLTRHLVQLASTSDHLEDQATPGNSLPKWHSVTSRAACDEVWLTLAFPEGLYDVENNSIVMATPVRLRIRKVGDVAWINLPEVHLTHRKTSAFRRVVKLVWGAAPSPLPQPSASAGAPQYAYVLTEAQTETPTSAAWQAHAHFDTGDAGLARYIDDGAFTPGTDTRVKNIALYEDRVEMFLAEGTFPKGQYEIQVKRGIAYRRSDFDRDDYTLEWAGFEFHVTDMFWYRQTGANAKLYRQQERVRKEMALLRVSSVWNEHPVAATGMALIAVKATNRSIADLSVRASGYVDDYDAATGLWSSSTITSNPAPHMRYALTEVLTARKLPAGLLDETSFIAFRQHVIDESLACNAVFGGDSLDDALTVMAACGRGRPYKSERWGVIVDNDRSADSPVQMFSPRNMNGFRWRKAFADVPHAFICRFRNAARDYQDDEVIVFRAGFDASSATLYETVSYVGLVTQAEVEARAAFDLAQAVERPAFYSGTAPAEALVCRRGDLVAVQHDAIDQMAGFARVKSKTVDAGNVTGVLLDSVIPLAAGDDVFADADIFDTPDIFAEQTGVMLRLKDGSVLIKEVTGSGEEDDALSFATPFADDADLDEGCLVVSGALTTEVSRMIVHAVRPAPELTAHVSFVDEAPALFS